MGTEWHARKRWVSEIKETYRLLKKSHKFLKFWSKTVRGNYGKRAKSERESGVSTLDNSKCANGGGTLNVHLYRQGGM